MKHNVTAFVQRSVSHSLFNEWLSSLRKIEREEETTYSGRTHLVFKRSGIDVTVDASNGEVLQIELCSSGVEGLGQYTGELPLGLAFDMSQSAVRKVLGEPAISQEGSEHRIFGYSYAWDRFDLLGYALHVTYSMEKSAIRAVAVTPPVPGSQ